MEVHATSTYESDLDGISISAATINSSASQDGTVIDERAASQEVSGNWSLLDRDGGFAATWTDATL